MALIDHEPTELTLAVSAAIDNYRRSNPDLTVLEILRALEDLRFHITEALLIDQDLRGIEWFNFPPTR